MTWTVSTYLRNQLAEGSDLDTMLTGGELVITDNASPLAELVSNAIASAVTTANAVAVTFSAGTVNSGISNQDGANAFIYDSASPRNLLLSTNSVTATAGGGDITFDDNTGWNDGDTVTAGVATITVTVTATTA